MPTVLSTLLNPQRTPPPPIDVDLARRVQSCVHRQTDYLAEMEDEVEDPGLLKFLHHIDHQAARIHRHAENLAVLGGADRAARPGVRPG